MIYVALDFPTWEASKQFIEQNDLHGIPVKVGMELFYREGPSVVERLKEREHPIFLDLKLHDIPTTVKRAMQNLGKLGVDLVNVHALGGRTMMEAAKEGLLSSGSNAKLIAVTILTSMDKETMNGELTLGGDVTEKAVHLAGLARQSGADGIVCSVHEARAIKEACGPACLSVTPGIRLADSKADDQKRVATPEFAREQGVDTLVIGRSITKAENPKSAYKRAVEEWGYDNKE
ncbi:orotidine-5'-phosphate decarboxylase [Salirhabdus sp. Marseille-P4669]|uniref:orotidine-5'-phosphate decarboxylase n=1 Tax=Salirhabdus sp. Marseille-P4669 TaxID=2042310 RepID=UPI000C79DEC4|nr:orotidine-5'-phosphate decarboxylase [Salirhabdus sp. Marseille-P4669]